MADARHTFRYRHARKATTPLERRIPNVRYTVWNRYTRKSTTFTKRTAPDIHHATRNRHMRQVSTTVERTSSDTRHGLVAESGRYSNGACRRRRNGGREVVVNLRRIVAIDSVRPRIARVRVGPRRGPCAERSGNRRNSHRQFLGHFSVPFKSFSLRRDGIIAPYRSASLHDLPMAGLVGLSDRFFRLVRRQLRSISH